MLNKRNIVDFIGGCVFTILFWVFAIRSFVTGGEALFAPLLSVIALIAHWCYWWVITPDFLGYEQKGGTYKSGEHYETTFRSDGTAVTKKVDDYSSDYHTDCPKIYCFLGAILGPVFFIFKH